MSFDVVLKSTVKNLMSNVLTLNLIHVYCGDMKKKTTRPYQMDKRSEMSAKTAQDIVKAVISLWHELPLKEITLEKIAARAGVTTRTIMRRFGSKEGLFKACLQNKVSDYQSQREKAEVGNIEVSVSFLLKDYEAHGDALIKTLAVENDLQVAHQALDAGRKYHRDWCQRIFEPYLTLQDRNSYEQKLRGFIAATEFYLWKLLRRDLNYSFDETKETFIRLVKGIASQN